MSAPDSRRARKLGPNRASSSRPYRLTFCTWFWLSSVNKQAIICEAIILLRRVEAE